MITDCLLAVRFGNKGGKVGVGAASNVSSSQALSVEELHAVGAIGESIRMFRV